LSRRPRQLDGARVTVMGLGLHGGGLACAQFLVSRGANVTVTDLRTEEELASSLAKLGGLDVRLVLGRHEEGDFAAADFVVKNPAVPPTSRYLGLARAVETDISLFLDLNRNPVLAVTGTKGKSTSVSAMYHAARKAYPRAVLGGNITVSPLGFLDEEQDGTSPVILELSSWQLGDLPDPSALAARVAGITNIKHDHQNRYERFDDYVRDKERVFAGQVRRDWKVINLDDSYAERFAAIGSAEAVGVSSSERADAGAWVRNGDRAVVNRGRGTEIALPRDLPGSHQRMNVLFAAVFLDRFGMDAGLLEDAFLDFAGVPHRMEPLREIDGVLYVNDSAATIPDAVVEAVRSYDRPVHLIAGGTDKALKFEPFSQLAGLAASIHLLEGSATEKIVPILRDIDCAFSGPHASLEDAFHATRPQRGDIVLLSPGCASFGMFRNEFDRGDRFRELVNSL
jgi:UDP-N-acetylmuramoylalanine--D-glutamate ligase